MTRLRTEMKVFVTPDERANIKRLAASANLSVSSYLRAAGLNLSVRSVDTHAANELAKVNGSLGRMAEIMKQSDSQDLRRMVKDIRELQTLSHQIMGRILR